MRLCAFKSWHTLLQQYEAPPLDVAAEEALDAFVVHRKASMPDGWY
jgi:trimethylamine--corrinoid protein Co-methyltransferase